MADIRYTEACECGALRNVVDHGSWEGFHCKACGKGGSRKKSGQANTPAQKQPIPTKQEKLPFKTDLQAFHVGVEINMNSWEQAYVLLLNTLKQAGFKVKSCYVMMKGGGKDGSL